MGQMMSRDSVMTHPRPAGGHGSQTYGVTLVTRSSEVTRSKAYSYRWRQIVTQAIARQPWCSDCGNTRNLEGDHEIPRSTGGLDVPGNCVVRCRPCNARKGNRAIHYRQVTFDELIAQARR
jgi:5-methylcytosine-specific restriction endonuclease McrA